MNPNYNNNYNNYNPNYNNYNPQQSVNNMNYNNNFQRQGFPNQNQNYQQPQNYPINQQQQNYPTNQQPQNYPTNQQQQNYPTNQQNPNYPNNQQKQNYPTNQQNPNYPTNQQKQNYPTNQKINYPQNQNYQQNPNQKYQQNPNQNYPQNPNYKQGQNMNYQQNQNMQQNQGVNQYQEKLRLAYNLFSSGVKDYKSFSLELALDKFEKVDKIIKEAYPHIKNNPNLKETTDKFQRQVTQYLTQTEYQIKHRFDYKSTAGYADVDSSIRQKNEIAQMIRDAEESNKKQNYYTPRNNNINNNIQKNNYNSNNTNINNNQNNNIKTNNNKKDDKAIVTNDLRDKILSEIVESKPDVKFDDVVGLKEAKQILKEIIIIPNLRPDLFTGLRSPPRGLLLFGPPGTGKTMIAKAVATECKCTFFSISASSLTSKYLGESEKLVRALFQLAYEMQPSVVFIDEIESILSKRKEGENDAMKRLKTEFLIQFDGVGSSEENRVLIIGATNRPFDLDPAVIRRLPKRVYVGPFNDEEKKGFIKKIITQNKCNISDDEFYKIAQMCKNYSNSDLKELCREAAYEPLRELNTASLQKVDELRPITFEDFTKAVRKVRGTLTKDILRQLEKWNENFGALGGA